jgi:Tfp pilus assembly protein PilF
MALGYIGGFTSGAKLSQRENLGDPKDKIMLFNRIKMAEGASSDREYEKALGLLDQVIKEDPGIMEARQVRANIYLQLDRADEAAEENRPGIQCGYLHSRPGLQKAQKV